MSGAEIPIEHAMRDPSGSRRLLAAALARVDAFLFERIDPEPAPAALVTHPRVVVAGLGPRAGATTIARALALELAKGAGGAAIASTPRVPARAAPSSRAARRLSVAFGGQDVRASGRLCLVAARPLDTTAAAARYLAPFVADWQYGEPVAAAAALAAPIVLVATPATDPALAAAAAASLPGAVLVLNRNRPLEEWDGTADVAVPDARIQARLATAGRPVAGAFGAAIAELAERVT